MTSSNTENGAEPGVIAIVDDDVDMGDALSLIVELSGFEPLYYEGGQALLDEPEMPQADCLMLDINMPGLDGWGVLAALRERGWTIPVILMSGLPIDADRAAASGAQATLSKPITPSAFEELINSILAGKS